MPFYRAEDDKAASVPIHLSTHTSESVWGQHEGDPQGVRTRDKSFLVRSSKTPRTRHGFAGGLAPGPAFAVLYLLAAAAAFSYSFFVTLISLPSHRAPARAARPRSQPPEHMCVSPPGRPLSRRRGRAPFAWSRSVSEGSAAPGPVMQHSCAGRPPC